MSILIQSLFIEQPVTVSYLFGILTQSRSFSKKWEKKSFFINYSRDTNLVLSNNV